MKTTDTKEIRDLLEQLRAEIVDLAGRVQKLEGKKAGPEPAAARTEPAKPEAAAAPQPQHEPISEEIVAAISACLADFLGVRVHIRQIRVIASPAWAQQGRVSIQASHQLH